MKKSGGQQLKLTVFIFPPVSLEEPSPPDSVSRGGSAGVLITQDRNFLAHDSKDSWTAVSVLNLVLVWFLSYSSNIVTLLIWCSSNLTELGPDSCPARRRQALFHLLSGSVAVPLQTSISDRSQTSCNSLVQTLRDLLPVEVEFPPFLSQLVEVVDGLFRTVGGALRALSHSSPQRLNENLFGGKFLKEIASSNFSGVLGSQGTFVRDWVSGKGDSLQENRVLVESVRRVLGDPSFLSSLKVALQGHSSLLPPEQVNWKNVCK